LRYGSERKENDCGCAFQVKGVKDSMPDGSSSIMSGLSMSDIDSNYDTMSISSKINISGSKMEYGRQKKK
jgi:hypothetical protein